MNEISDPILALHAVYKDYRKGKGVIRALSGISLSVKQGEVCVFMGPSGSGKSTLLNVIGGLDTPTSGSVVIGGQETTGFSDRQWTTLRREMLGMVFQAFHLIPGLTVLENVALPAVLRDGSSPAVEERVRQSLERVKMLHRAGHRPSELSGGEQQRVAIARAFVNQPKLILADEPTGNLDSHNAKTIIALLHDIAKHQGQTVLLVTHAEMASSVADRRFEMRDGQLHALN